VRGLGFSISTLFHREGLLANGGDAVAGRDCDRRDTSAVRPHHVEGVLGAMIIDGEVPDARTGSSSRLATATPTSR
jgi:hypothetical protein